ncbi:sterol desaturase family protein [Acaryochloris marina NIES-2412]|uniref:sterol desaturase family protein n=1 Tax=Acaryochloris marina TaxID=155978 RepID=UPI0040591B1F
MTILNIQGNFWLYWFMFCGIMMSGYFTAAASIYWLMYLAVGKQPTDGPHEGRLQDSKVIVADIKLSVLSVIFFALGAACFMVCYNQGLTRVYADWKIQNLSYFIFSYVLVLWLQDAYFYFFHRLFHLPSLFKWFHQGHHQSRPPTPWTFFALEPMEAAIQASFLLSITFIIPLHIGVLISILLTMTIWALGNHIGYQVVPYSRLSCCWGRWCIGSAHHLVHHQRYSKHYGLYFTFWDKVMGTQDASYKAQLGVWLTKPGSRPPDSV